MNKKIYLPVAIVIAVAVGAATWAWMAHRPAVDPDELTLYGNVDIRQVSLAFNATERIAEVRVREGDPVRAGAVLAVLDERTPLAGWPRARLRSASRSRRCCDCRPAAGPRKSPRRRPISPRRRPKRILPRARSRA